MTAQEIITGIVEKMTDNIIAVAIIGTALYMAVTTSTPEWLIGMAGLIVKDYLPSVKTTQ